jgi:hypothetical protein
MSQDLIPSGNNTSACVELSLGLHAIRRMLGSGDCGCDGLLKEDAQIAERLYDGLSFVLRKCGDVGTAAHKHLVNSCLKRRNYRTLFRTFEVCKCDNKFFQCSIGVTLYVFWSRRNPSYRRHRPADPRSVLQRQCVEYPAHNMMRPASHVPELLHVLHEYHKVG